MEVSLTYYTHIEMVAGLHPWQWQHCMWAGSTETDNLATLVHMVVLRTRPLPSAAVMAGVHVLHHPTAPKREAASLAQFFVTLFSSHFLLLYSLVSQMHPL